MILIKVSIRSSEASIYQAGFNLQQEQVFSKPMMPVPVGVTTNPQQLMLSQNQPSQTALHSQSSSRKRTFEKDFFNFNQLSKQVKLTETSHIQSSLHFPSQQSLGSGLQMDSCQQALI